MVSLELKEEGESKKRRPGNPEQPQSGASRAPSPGLWLMAARADGSWGILGGGKGKRFGCKLQMTLSEWEGACHGAEGCRSCTRGFLTKDRPRHSGHR